MSGWMQRKKRSLHELGLVVLGRWLPTGDLHFGLWKEGVDPLQGNVIENVVEAQRRFSDALIAKIPSHVKRVLDVGCGTGSLAELLVQAGYQVESLAPSPGLTSFARKRLGERVRVHTLRFQEFRAETKFDLVLFSESFQYVYPAETALRCCLAALKPGGHVLISDFFRRPQVSTAVSGGHDWEKFSATLKRLPFHIVHDEDWTQATAPTMNLRYTVTKNYLLPLVEESSVWLRNEFPWVYHLGRRIFAKRIRTLHGRIIAIDNAEEFIRAKTYRCLLLQRTDEAALPTAA